MFLCRLGADMWIFLLLMIMVVISAALPVILSGNAFEPGGVHA